MGVDFGKRVVKRNCESLIVRKVVVVMRRVVLVGSEGRGLIGLGRGWRS